MPSPSNYIQEVERQIGLAKNELDLDKFRIFLYEAVLVFDKYAKQIEDETDKTIIS